MSPLHFSPENKEGAKLSDLANFNRVARSFRVFSASFTTVAPATWGDSGLGDLQGVANRTRPKPQVISTDSEPPSSDSFTVHTNCGRINYDFEAYTSPNVRKQLRQV